VPIGRLSEVPLWADPSQIFGNRDRIVDWVVSVPGALLGIRIPSTAE
jgi:hypothetical protein